MRLLVVFALVCIVGAYAFGPMGAGSYYGGGGGMENGYGSQGQMGAGGANNGVFDSSDTGFRRIEEGHNRRNFGAQNSMGGMNQGGGNYGYGRGGNQMYGGGGFGGGPMGMVPPMGAGIGMG